jgi:hypothetical protein
LQAFYSVRSEMQLMEQLDYNVLFRWFVGLSLDAELWDETVFTNNRERLIEGNIARRFMAVVLNQEPVKALLSDDHFLGRRHADRSLGQHEELSPQGRRRRAADPGRKSERDFHGEKRRNETHASTTDPDARLYRKGRANPPSLPVWGTF